MAKDMNSKPSQQSTPSVSSGTGHIRDERAGSIKGTWQNNGGSHKRGQQ